MLLMGCCAASFAMGEKTDEAKPKRDYSSSVPADTLMNRLGRTYEKLKANPSAENQHAYFNAFPSTWSDYFRMDKSKDGYSAFELDWAEAFAKLDAVNDTVFCIKLFNLVRGAVHDCDGPYYLKMVLNGTMSSVYPAGASYTSRDRGRVMLWLLSKLRAKGEVFRFWEYYWSSLKFETQDGPGKEEREQFVQMISVLEKEYPKMVKPCTDAFNYFSREVWFLSMTDDYARFGIKYEPEIEEY